MSLFSAYQIIVLLKRYVYMQSTPIIKDTLGPRVQFFIEGVSFIEGFVECIVIMFVTDSSVHCKESAHLLLRASVSRYLTVLIY